MADSMKVSVIIPVYNAGKYIETCVVSAARQSIEELEILCIDDGSTDDSLAVLRRMQESDDRIRIIEQANQGSGKARNQGILQARGEFLLFLDADDYLLDQTALKRMYQTCKENHVSICGAFRNIDREGKTAPMSLHRKECDGYPGGRKMSYREYQYAFHFSTYLYERKLLTAHQIFFPDYRRFQDPPFFVKAMIAAEEFYILPVELYCFRSGHQNYAFSHRQVNDIVRGLTDLLRMSSEKELKKLHLLAVSRLNEGFFWNIVQHLDVDNGELLSLLMEAERMVRQDWAAGLCEETDFCLKALRFLLRAGVEKCENYRRELAARGYGEVQLGCVFPFHRVPPKSRVILYAAGVMGWTYYRQIRENTDYTLVAWVDRQYGKYADSDPKIRSVESIWKMNYDYIVIAIEEEWTAMEIISSLREMGVPEEKIVWGLSI